ncbi:hypothetical protein ACWGLE_11635 [Streptomyces sp. NPDC055897]
MRDPAGERQLRPYSDEARLAHVAVTRARHRLDPVGPAWLDRHPDAPAR